jgi:hypothetical protein
MNQLIQLRTPTPLFLVVCVLACFALLPRVQAVPDPATPRNANTRDGAGALSSKMR